MGDASFRFCLCLVRVSDGMLHCRCDWRGIARVMEPIAICHHCVVGAVLGLQCSDRSVLRLRHFPGRVNGVERVPWVDCLHGG